MYPLVLSDLDLLAVYLPLLLSFKDKLLLVLHFRSLPPDLDHRIQVRNLHGQRLLGRREHATSTSVSLLALPVIGSFEHLVTLGELWLGMHVWLQLLTLELAGTWIVDNVVIDGSYRV